MGCTIPGHKSQITLTISGQYWRKHMHAAPSACQIIPRSQYSTGMNTCILHSLVRVSQDPSTVLVWTHAWCTSACQSIPRSRDTPITYISCKGCLVLRCLQLGSSFLICKKCVWLSPSEALDCLLFNGTMSNWSQTFLICWFHRSEVTLIS